MRPVYFVSLFVPLLAQPPAMPIFPHHGTGWPAPVLDNHITNLSRSISGRPMLSRPDTPSIPIGFGFGFAAQPWMQPVYAPPPAPVVIVNQQAPPPPAFVMVNPEYRPENPRPVMTEYSNTSKPYEHFQPGAPKVFLIALKDGTLRQAVAFWREDDTLHLVQPDHKQTSLKMTELDSASTVKFNAERGIEIRLP
ncbi:MAG: hypothetical protein FJW30_09065 [Acidobacteria bacterium]|nr:hypothetical protein [Acidobacteriota bacterium]